ncbi:MAG TPA: UPF0182 family protein [Acidobacteriota bacterium]|nr:UPF0182 family protein [Acidobacteriota bacterium]
MRTRISWIVVLIALLVILGSLTFAVDLYFDLLWFQELGKTTVFTTTLYAKSVVGCSTLLLTFLFFYLNLWLANRGAGLIQIGIPTPTGQITAYTFSRESVRRAGAILSFVGALFFALKESDSWEIVWRWIHQVAFNVKDPVFGRDVSFYFFDLPFWEEAVSVAMAACFVTGVAVLVLYHFKGTLVLKSLRTAGRRGRAGVHISILAAAFFLLLAADAYLSRFGVLYSTHDVFSGASYADLHARVPMLGILAAASVLGSLLWIYNIFATNLRGAIVAVILYFGVAFLGKGYPALVQKFIVAPNELGRELPQIENNIHGTLSAYGLSQVEDRSLSGDRALTPRDIQQNAATIHSIRLWDHEPLLDAFSQIQEIRTYYDFTTVDNDRYRMNGEAQQMMLSPRELNSASLPERNWINEHLSYTHGFGLTLGPVNRVTSEGLPVLLVKDIPPKSDYPIFNITRPEIYFGELSKGYVVVKTGQKEFDYPHGETNEYCTYEGGGGVPVGSFLRKLLFAFYFKDPNIVLSPLLTPESRFLYFRDLRTRFTRVAPFLTLDQDPYMVISGGKLYWIQDGYTTGDRYPYSTQLQDKNYIRNSVKLVLDAYNGSVDLYISDPRDPLIQVYQRIFPGIYRPISDMPADLRLHLRYPEDIFRIQTYIYSVYHMANPQVFYNKEDLWQIPVLSSGNAETPMSPYYTIMRLPQEKQEEFILMLPFTPGRKDNLSAWMVARSDGEHYGQLVVYRFPKQKLVYGPKQIVARINQDAEISRQISLWDQHGSQVIQGTLLVIPIEEALLYVRPLYLRAESGKIPELKRVIVAYENKIAMEETLEASIGRIFQTEIPAESGSQPPLAPIPAPPEAVSGTQRESSLIQQAREYYDRAVQAQRQGDWARYGEELKRLGEVLDQLGKTSPDARRQK